MLFWIVLTIMLGSAIFLAILPLLRSARNDSATAETFDNDIAVFKDQLAEIERDLKRGVLNERDAESARSEISRRLIEANAKAENTSETAASGQKATLFRKFSAAFAFVVVPVIAALMYVTLGSPELNDQPLQARVQNQQQNSDQSQILGLVERVETHLAANPDDDQGWEVVAPVYQRMGRYDDAVRAFENIIRLRGDTEPRLSDLGEAIVLSQEGVVTQRAEKLFQRGIALDATAIRPRFFLAMGLTQESKFQQAAQAWEALLEEATPQSAWAPGALDQLNMARSQLGLPPAEPSNSAASIMSLSQQEQQEMISTMVAGLAAKLEEEPGNLADWLRLIRSYVVLERPDDAVEALRKAETQFASDQRAMTELNDMAGSLGLTAQN
uniref:c-type cytochrome biogenesis protein CcmI n=1 Tax=Pararhizobium sp. IMCC3301 TaxID=3067904 RepID=UPI002740E5E8|nr:c-type cytochrome biogenesis protein CcmI [Pararhizobium sp. IMCC3301]